MQVYDGNVRLNHEATLRKMYAEANLPRDIRDDLIDAVTVIAIDMSDKLMSYVDKYGPEFGLTDGRESSNESP